MKRSMSRNHVIAWVVCAMSMLAANSYAQVVINEVNYHPSNSAVMPGEDAESLQFVELYNSGPGAADLSGWSFSQGVVYTFPAGTTLGAGQYLVVAEDPAFLALRGPVIPGGVQVLQWTSGDLSNGGEAIELVDATATMVDQVVYDDAGLWPAAADGSGPSLELVNPAYDNTLPLAWRASAGDNGTPGAQNSRFTASPIIILDAPERGSVVAALTDVSLTFSGPVSGVTAAGLVVDGSPATVLTCATCVGGIGAGPYVFSGFAAPTSNPMTVTLASGTIVDTAAHPFAGDTWTYFLSVPKIVINELHYNPLSSTDYEEFIELYNADPAAVDISGWVLSEFASPGCLFPPGTVMQPGAYIVCAKDPVSLEAATGYHTDLSWGINDSLSNGGEPVALLNGSGTVVDRVVYDDDPPWPSGPGSPDGYGPSLELINPALDNSQGQFWHSSTVMNGTPGARNSTYSDAPVVSLIDPAPGSVVAGLTEISVTFSKAVTGVTADDLEVDGTPSTAVTGTGAGPYVFTVTGLAPGTIAVVLSSGGIQDLQGTPFTGDSWQYFYSLPALVINEIHYHPSPAAVLANENPEDLQFLELYNAGPSALDLAGYAMTEGIGYTFPAGITLGSGEFLVLAKDASFLQSKVSIPGGVQVLTWATGDLANGGETLELSDPYGRVIDVVTYDDAGDWPDAPDGDGPSLELINPGLRNEAAGAWKASTGTNGTPGAPNSVYEANPAPIIFATLHTPPIPRANQTVTITTTAIDESGPPQSVILHYRLDQDPPIAYSSTPMYDDGLHADGAAGDGRYGAAVAGLPDGTQLDFYIEATDGVGTSVAPVGHALNNRFGYPAQTFLCKFSNEVLPTDAPVYHILVTLNNKHNQEALQGEFDRQEQFDATFIDGQGNVWYNAPERYRGQSSIVKLPSSYRVDFPSNRKLDSALGFPVETLQLNSMRPAAQWLGYDLFNRAGLAAPKVAWAHLRYTGINYDTCCAGQNGYYGMHVVVERVDSDFADSQGGAVPDRGMSSEGNLYRGRNDGDLRWEGTNPDTYRTDSLGRNGYQKQNNEAEDFWGDLIPLCDALNNTPAAQYLDHVRAHVDTDNWARFFAIHMLLGNREGGIYRDTGDDYFIYFNPPADPNNPPHPDFGTTQMPADRTSNSARMIPWDTDSVLMDSNETIWRTNVAAVRNVIRSNAVAPVFVKDIEDIATDQFSPAVMNAIIDSMPNSVFATSGGSDLFPETKQQFKNWIANRVPFVLTETVDVLTLAGVPSSPYEDANPVIHLSGTLPQAGTANLTVNGSPATFSIYSATWSYDLTLTAGMNDILVQAWDGAAQEKARAAASVFYNPPGALQLGLELNAPPFMVNDRTLTIEARIVDPIGRVAWNQWDELGALSVVRLPGRTPVAITDTVFDSHIAVPDDSIHFFNGWGSVSFTLDDGAAFVPGDIEVTVSWSGLTASRTVTVLGNPAFRTMSGTLSGADLIWGPDEAIRITSNATVPAGSTLTINPGTMIQVDTTGSLENGTLITVNGTVQAIGTKARPIFFFSERGPAAMTLTQSGSASNGDAWRGFQFYGSGTSTFRRVFLTGAGNGNVVSHPRPPILGFFDTHSILAEDCVFADNDGMVFSGQGTGHYTIRRNLVSRDGIGGEFFGNGHTLLIEDSWFTGIGRAPEAANLDGDALHVDGPSSVQLIRGCIINDGGDDGIDHNGSSFTVENSIISHVRDKAVSMTGGHVNMRNSLIFATSTGIRGTAAVDHVTMNVSAPIDTVDSAQRSIFWPSSISTCSGDVDYTDVGNAADLGCGTGNLSANPLFVDATHGDFNLQAGSPALTAGPNGGRIGWLGFPFGATCTANEDCDDGNPCTFDACEALECTFTPIVGCRACESAVDCDDGNPCTVDSCNAGTCAHAAGNEGYSCDDGLACTSPDICMAGVCAGAENCPGGQHCGTGGVCSAEPATLIFRDGLNGYAGTQDTELTQATPGTVNGALEAWGWDTDDPSGTAQYVYGLVRFDNIFGGSAGQIPPGSAITSATLTIQAFDPSATPAAGIYEAMVDWNEGTATWNNFGGEAGVQADEYANLVASAPINTGSAVLDVTTSLQAWTLDPAANRGWIVVPASTNGVDIRSSEYTTTPAERPTLTVTYVPGVVGCTSDPECDDGQYCNGAEHCVANVCQAGLSVDCNDGVACTVDSCNETTDTCGHVLNDAVCDDGNVCTNDSCNATAGCVHVDNTNSCDDGNVCTSGDVCSGGTCLPGVGTLDCNDGVACTVDSCDPATGCSNVDSCTVGETCNHGTGLCEGSTVAPLPIVVGDDWRYLKGTAAPPAGWAGISFNDNAWAVGASGFGYGTDCAASHGTVLSDMQNGYLSVFMRRPFRVDDPAAVATLTFTVDYDDAFVLYINGTEVARRNIVGSPPAYNQVATADHECSSCNSTCNAAEDIDLTTFKNLLVPGTNVLAIQAHNLTLGSSDFTLSPSLAGTETSMSVAAAGPRYITVTPPAGAASVALLVRSAGLACLPRYVDDAGRLGDTPVFRSSAAWGTVHVGDRLIVPGTVYTVEAQDPGGGVMASGSATTWLRGDADNSGGVNIFDILCVLDGSQGIFTKCTPMGSDVGDFTPDGIVDGQDIQAVLDSFMSLPYPDTDPCGAPPLTGPTGQ